MTINYDNLIIKYQHKIVKKKNIKIKEIKNYNQNEVQKKYNFQKSKQKFQQK